MLEKLKTNLFFLQLFTRLLICTNKSKERHSTPASCYSFRGPQVLKSSRKLPPAGQSSLLQDVQCREDRRAVQGRLGFFFQRHTKIPNRTEIKANSRNDERNHCRNDVIKSARHYESETIQTLQKPRGPNSSHNQRKTFIIDHQVERESQI